RVPFNYSTLPLFVVRCSMRVSYGKWIIGIAANYACSPVGCKC
ncbi:MAG: hypothetical protein ACI92G_003721, partial [Candidatus Pelagisphaera sp.]